MGPKSVCKGYPYKHFLGGKMHVLRAICCNILPNFSEIILNEMGVHPNSLQLISIQNKIDSWLGSLDQ